MQYKPLVLGDLSVPIPLIQGGMGIGISLGGLAGSVAKAGAIGIISAAQIGFREPDFDVNPLECNLRAMESEYQKAKRLAPEGIVGFNIMVAMNHYERYVKKAIELGANLIISGAGLPTELPKLSKDTKIKIAPIVSTEKSARILFKLWDKKDSRCPDLVVIEGPKAGGHLGFKKEQLSAWNDVTYMDEIRKIKQVVAVYEEKYQRKIPIVLAGGIYDKRSVQKAFSLQMDGVQVASRFVTTKECDADDGYKQAYIKAKKEDILIVDSPVGMPGRAIRNPLIEKVMQGERETLHRCHECLRSCKPLEIPYCITDALVAAAKGDTEHGLLFCGANVDRQRKMESVKEVIDSLMK